MKFLILSHFAGAPKYGMVFRNHTWASELVKQGHDVTVVASNYSHTRNSQPETSGYITKEDIDGAQYLWVKGFSYNPKSAIMRILAMFWFTFQTYFFPPKLEDDYDVIVMSSPQPFTILTASKWAKKFNAKLIYDIRDLWPLTLVEIGGQSKRNPLIWLMQKMEDYSCKVADLVTPVQKDCEIYLKQRGLRDGRFMHISNGITDKDLYEPKNTPLPSEHTVLLKQLKNEGKFIIGYAGAIGLANCLHTLVEALSNTDEKIHAVCVGHGNFHDQLIEQAKSLGVESRLHFLPAIKRPQVNDFLKNIDVAYITFRKADMYKLGVSPTKLNDYMAACKPVLYPVDEVNNPIDQSQGGVSCEAENSEAIAQGLNHLASLSQKELEKLGQQNRKWLEENHRVSEQMKNLVEKLESL